MLISPKTLISGLSIGGILLQTASATMPLEIVPVGNAGNGADPTTGYGAVAYDYGIGKYEVTLYQYTTFLNAVAATDTYGLYNTQMGLNQNIMGISRSGQSGSYTYAVIGSGARPVTYVSWYDAARFVNWLCNGQPIGPQVAGITESGAYTLAGNSGLVTRKVGTPFGLPTQDEWYKAAYHQPARQGGDVDDFWLYPTASNVMPNSRNGSDTDANSANFWWDDDIDNGFNGGYAVTDAVFRSNTQNYLTDVGAFSLARSFYGTFDQGGNVAEWTDTMAGLGLRLRGGGWVNIGFTDYLSASSETISSTPADENFFNGFRVVVIPEPGVMSMTGLGIAILVWKRKRML